MCSAAIILRSARKYCGQHLCLSSLASLHMVQLQKIYLAYLTMSWSNKWQVPHPTQRRHLQSSKWIPARPAGDLHKRESNRM
eukprot:scaffold6094_cov141-Skeletonema_dohrnii-CCMP3373.AAC.4